MNTGARKQIAVIVAHPDDETLWAGGTLLNHPEWDCFIACLCRKNDPDRAPKFERVLSILNANGSMGVLDDEPEQHPLPTTEVQGLILQLLPQNSFDLILTHSIYGEYTRHLRHEEVGEAIIRLWANGALMVRELWTFAYEDGGRAYFPRAIADADHYEYLPENTWNQKYHIITDVYGFRPDSWEAQATPKTEAFHKLINANDALQQLSQKGADV